MATPLSARRILPRGISPAAGGRAASDRRLGYALVAPAVIVLLAITAYPLVYNVWNSFHHDNLLIPDLRGFSGLANYAELFTNEIGRAHV